MFKRFCSILSGFYTKLYRGHENTPAQGSEVICNQEEQRPPGTADKRMVLLTSRSKTGAEDSEGFPETYYCTKCRDYFVLAWEDAASPRVEQYEVVENSHPCLRGRDAEQAKVFCPVCHTEYAMYGLIPQPNTDARRMEAPEVYEAHEYPFPPDVSSSPAGCIKFGSLAVEKIVLLVTGQFPVSMEIGEFACSGVIDHVGAKFGTELLVSDVGGIRLHVLRTSAICDETAWLTALLQREVYRNQKWGTKIFLTLGPLPLRAPLKEALFCLVQRPI